MNMPLRRLALLLFWALPVAALAAETFVAREKIAPVLQRCLDSDASWSMEKRSPGEIQPLVSTGTVSCAKGQGVAWQTLSPFPALTRITPLWRITEEEGICTTNSLAELPHYEQVHAFVEALSEGDSSALETHFLVLAETTDHGTWSLTLTPRNSRVKRFFSTIVLSGAESVEQAVMTSEDGSATVIRFSQQGVGAHSLWPEKGSGE